MSVTCNSNIESALLTVTVVFAEEVSSEDTDDSLVRLVESPLTEPEPTPTPPADTSLQLRLMSCQSCDSVASRHHTEPEICGYYLAVSRPSYVHQRSTKLDESITHDARSSDVDVDSAINIETLSSTDVADDDDSAVGSSNVPAAETVVKPTGAVMSDAEVTSSESQAQSAAAAADDDDNDKDDNDDDATATPLTSSLPGTSTQLGLFDLIIIIIVIVINIRTTLRLKMLPVKCQFEHFHVSVEFSL